jgi:hypothetical protein
MEQRERSFGQKWSESRPSKTGVFWSLLATAVITMIVGFTWGGWVTGGTARQMAATSAEDAVVSRLTPMCVLQVKQDPKQTEKLKEFKEVSAWQQGEYVKKQGWATMPGEKEAEGRIADACAKVLNQ